MRAVTVNAETMVTTIIDLPREDSLRTMQDAVGGYVECVTFDGFEMWLNEEGKLMGLPINEVATALWEAEYGPTDVIVGNVLITGPADEDGFTTELSAETALLVQGVAGVMRTLAGVSD